VKAAEQIWRSSPRRTVARILEKTFVGDGELVERLVDQVVQSAETPNKHYNVIVGGAGIGKSHTLAMVVGRVRKLNADLAIAWLPDDPSGLASELHLFEAILAALGRPALERDRAADRDAADARRRVVEALAGRALLLCVERLDQVLAALGAGGQRGLRGFLQEERCCAVLGTAEAMTKDFTDQARPFFGFFGVHRIDELDAKSTIRLVAAHARARGDAELATAAKSVDYRAMFLALHHVLGGSPGRYVDLVRHARELDDPDALLLRALDEHERWTRAALEQCSTQQRLVLYWLSGQRGAVQVKSVARACSISEQTVSPQLRYLRNAGWVTATRVGRETWYEMRDPLHGIDWEDALELFRFLRVWFADRELALAESSAVGGRIREALADDAADEAADDPRRVLALPLLERRIVATCRPSRAP
jgi:DNA-binding transcriptional ArsR family regulator